MSSLQTILASEVGKKEEGEGLATGEADLLGSKCVGLWMQ